MSLVDNMTRISVVIPTWNRARTIRAAVESALAQTLPPLEILICDDGSTDDTAAVVRMIDDARVKWLPGSHQGRPAIPRNRGIAAAQGEWLAFLDSDDVWLPKKLERQMAAINETGALAACTDAWRYIPGVLDRTPLLGGRDEMLGWHELLRCNRVVCSSAVVKRTLIDRVHGFPETEKLRTGQDYGLWVRVANFTKFAYLSEPLVLYRDDVPNGVRAYAPDGWTQRILVLEDFLEWCGAHPSECQPVVYDYARREVHRCRIRRCIHRVLNMRRWGRVQRNKPTDNG